MTVKKFAQTDYTFVCVHTRKKKMKVDLRVTNKFILYLFHRRASATMINFKSVQRIIIIIIIDSKEIIK